MKRTIHLMTLIILMMLSNLHVYAQGGAVLNLPGAGSNVLGWDGTVGAGAQDINLQNQFANSYPVSSFLKATVTAGPKKNE